MQRLLLLSLLLLANGQLFEKLAREQQAPKQYDSFANILKQKGQQPMEPRSLFDKLAGEDHGSEPMRFQQMGQSAPVQSNPAPQVYLDLSQKGVEVAYHRVKLAPEVELHLGNTKVMVRELEVLVNFNRKLMEKYGSNLEKCQPSRGQEKQEVMGEMGGQFRFSQMSRGGEEGADKMADSLEHELLEIG